MHTILRHYNEKRGMSLGTEGLKESDFERDLNPYFLQSAALHFTFTSRQQCAQY